MFKKITLLSFSLLVILLMVSCKDTFEPDIFMLRVKNDTVQTIEVYVGDIDYGPIIAADRTNYVNIPMGTSNIYAKYEGEYYYNHLGYVEFEGSGGDTYFYTIEIYVNSGFLTFDLIED